jgi:hypothetical protein
MPKTTPNRAPHDRIQLMPSPEDGERIRSKAARYGMSLTDYVTALVRGETLTPMPAAFSQLGACISNAIAALDREDMPEVRRLLTLARKHGADVGREWLLPAYKARVAELAEDEWGTPG